MDAIELRRRREALGWTPERLADRAGVTAQQVRNIETGRTQNPRPNTMLKLKNALLTEEGRRCSTA